MPLPFREIRLPLAPPLYHWDDDSVVTFEDSLEGWRPVTSSSSSALTTLSASSSSAAEAPDCTSERALQTKALHKLPPRRPRRCVSPPRQRPKKLDIGSIPLKPLEFHKRPSPATGQEMSEQQQQQQQQQREQTLEYSAHSRKTFASHHSGASDNNTVVEIKYDSPQSLDSLVSSKQITPAPNTVTSNNGATLVFCIRRSGCGVCRGHGMQLSELAANFRDVTMLGVVKPEAVPEAQLLEFYTDYFNFPLYQDDDWKLFSALGDRQLSLWKLLKCIPKLAKRNEGKQIHNIPFGGDIWTHGGLLIFDAAGRVRFVYYEKYGEELDTEAIAWAIDQARQCPLNKDDTATRNDTSVMTKQTSTTSHLSTDSEEKTCTTSYPLTIQRTTSPWGRDIPPRRPKRNKQQQERNGVPRKPVRSSSPTPTQTNNNRDNTNKNSVTSSQSRIDAPPSVPRRTGSMSSTATQLSKHEQKATETIFANERIEI
mmetsp:Transcript_6444/g.13289  ORF Transcript_6444/g.13289 Transcript_6444/m.13289 type:complete len:483 (+) Transcript_6444:115-1563(+)